MCEQVVRLSGQVMLPSKQATQHCVMCPSEELSGGMLLSGGLRLSEGQGRTKLRFKVYLLHLCNKNTQRTINCLSI